MQLFVIYQVLNAQESRFGCLNLFQRDTTVGAFESQQYITWECNYIVKLRWYMYWGLISNERQR